jgi:two-component system, NarL family, sensor histidine kinase DesK
LRLLPRDRGFGWSPYIWLVYLAGLPFNVWIRHAGVWPWVITIAGMVVFLPLYFLSYWAGTRGRLWIAAGMTLLGVLSAPVNTGASVYFVYAAAVVGLKGDIRYSIRGVCLILLIIATESLLLRLPPYFWVIAAIFTIMIGAINTNMAQRQRDQKRLLQAQDEVERMAKIAERERIARDLHDVLGHTLSVIVLKSELAAKLAEADPARAAQEIRDVERISREALAEVRSTVRGYQTRGWSAEVAQAEAALRAAGVNVHGTAASVVVPPSHEGVLALILREGVTNVIRHAQASTCELSLCLVDGVCRLEIADDGCGSRGPEGTGLAGIRSRVEALGGEFRREVAAGTRLIVTLPVPSP